ncbi:phage tail sheath C-terminal domain-containing protein [Roseomonas marmotae]|uniref:Phage tail sheath family protein n=1 Tax=Roseomonas marmotae TaxID=2768161 RepID=A0ABS3KFD1_9PROT|nr:phage tail sheath C-terminal domain-containing protein [Roseomonas marmotae]MBO1076183.1 phage tail sheath family protein [Roseomonas marmotae]QTI81781.1 phage tail sheath family protein [Roseomonas marmotae]
MDRAPGLYWTPPRKPAALPATAIDVPAFIGLAERGPLHAVTVVEGWPGFKEIFGGFWSGAQLAWTVRGFFENGGRRCHVVRVAAAPAAALSSGVQPANRLSSLVDSTLGFAAGAAVRVEQAVDTTATGPQPVDRQASIVADAGGLLAGDRVAISQAGQRTIWRVLQDVDPAAQRLTWDSALPPEYDLTQPIDFSLTRAVMWLLDHAAPGALHWAAPLPDSLALNRPMRFMTGTAPAEGVLYDENGAPILRIAAATAGAWGNALEVRLSRGVSAETRSRSVPVADAPDALSAASLNGFSEGATLTLSQDGTPPLRRRLRGIDTTARRLLLDQSLVGFSMGDAASGARPISVRSESFSLTVLEAGRLVESHGALALPESGDLPLISRRILATRLATPPGYPMPDPQAGLFPAGVLLLSGGRDGCAAVTDLDLLGGLELLAQVDEPAAIAIPDAQPEPTAARQTATLPAMPPDPCVLDGAPSMSLPEAIVSVREAMPPLTSSDLRTVQRAMIAQCEERGDRIALLDAPRGGVADPFDPDAVRDWRIGIETRFGALYWPWLQVADSDAPRAASRLIPPCGHVLGMVAASDAGFGPQKAPANLPMEWVQAVTREAEETRRALLNEAGINVIRALPARGIRACGARSLSQEPDHRLLNMRRIMIMLRRALRVGLAWVPFEPDNTMLRRQIRGALESFLEELWRQGVLAGTVAEEAFAISMEPPDDGRLVINIAVAPVAPAEFVLLTLTRQDEAVEIAEPMVPQRDRLGAAA